jgi:hypothetical protein
MDTTRFLLSLAQMALAIAGFSGLLIAFTRTPGKPTDLERYRLQWLFGPSFGARSWRSCRPLPGRGSARGPGVPDRAGACAFTVIWYAFQIGPTAAPARDAGHLPTGGRCSGLPRPRRERSSFTTAAAGAWGDRIEGIFACGIVRLMFTAAYQFSRILFVRPDE